MNNNLKTIMALLSLVLVGFIAGFFTDRMLVRKELRRQAAIRYALGFEKQLIHFLELDAEQLQQVKPAIGEFAGEIARVQREAREQRETLIDSLKQAIRPHLTAGQIERMEKFSGRFRPPPEMELRRRKMEDLRRQRGSRPELGPPPGWDSMPPPYLNDK